MPRMKNSLKMSDYHSFQKILKRFGWDAKFQPVLGSLQYLLLQKKGREPLHLFVPNDTYATRRLPASFFLNAFAEAGITDFGGFVDDFYALNNWGFYVQAGHYEKVHPSIPNAKAVLRLDADSEQPYLMLEIGSTDIPLLMGQPKSIWHLLHIMESNGLFSVDAVINTGDEAN